MFALIVNICLIFVIYQIIALSLIIWEIFAVEMYEPYLDRLRTNLNTPTHRHSYLMAVIISALFCDN